MKYFFVLGNNPTLSIAELSVFLNLENKNAYVVNKNILIVESEIKYDCSDIINKLGGVVKIGIIYSEIEISNLSKISKKVEEIIKPGDSKFNLGFSCYGNYKLDLRKFGMAMKNKLKSRSISCRIVMGRENVLSSVSVKKNRLLDKGAEIIFIRDKERILIGQTIDVQFFEQLSFRDYGRPSRDDRSGMLPPKLAQIMINLSGISNIKNKSNIKILDPFCGSGTILTEAELMGFKNIIGTDLSQKAIDDSRKNIDWINEKFKISTNIELKQFDVLELSKCFEKNSIDAIITEPYLGPQRGVYNIGHIVSELEKLYKKSIEEFRKILKPNGIVVMIWPIFVRNKNKTYMFQDTVFDGFDIRKTIPNYLCKNDIVKFSSRNTIVYNRDWQKVWREIVVLRLRN